ncbi:MAG: response regulator [Candidatus Doudnabacteria bacterium]
MFEYRYGKDKILTFHKLYGTVYTTLRGISAVSRILIVDDDEFIRNLLTSRLLRSNPNAHLVLAASVTEAATLIDAHDDLGALLTDFNLGDGTGNDVARHFRKKFPRARVLGMTGNPHHEFDRDIFERVLSKPFPPDDRTVLDSLCS